MKMYAGLIGNYKNCGIKSLQDNKSKTEFCSVLKDNLIIDLEEGSSHVSALKYVVNNFAELTELGREIMKAENPYKFITIDTITKLEEWCEADATLMYMNSPVGKNYNRYDEGSKVGQLKPKDQWSSVLTLPNGGGYYWLRLSYTTWLDKLKVLAPYVILIAHIKDKYLEKQGKEVAVKDLDLTGKIRAISSAGADAIGYVYRSGANGENLRISFQSSDSVLCGARPRHLRGQDMEADWSKIFIE